MNVGLKYKGVAAPTQGFVWTFFYQYVACCDDELVDLVEQFRGEQADASL